MKKIVSFAVVLLCAAAANAQQTKLNTNNRTAIKNTLTLDSVRQLQLAKDSATKKPVKKIPQKAAANVEAKRKD